MFPSPTLLQNLEKIFKCKNRAKQILLFSVYLHCLSLQSWADSLKLTLSSKIKNPISKWDSPGMVHFSYSNIFIGALNVSSVSLALSFI